MNPLDPSDPPPPPPHAVILSASATEVAVQNLRRCVILNSCSLAARSARLAMAIGDRPELSC